MYHYPSMAFMKTRGWVFSTPDKMGDGCISVYKYQIQ